MILHKEKTVFERHAQSLVQVVIAGLCFWMANTTNITATEVAVLTERMAHISAQIDVMHDSVDRQYTREDAKRDLELVHRRLDNQSARIKNMEGG